MKKFVTILFSIIFIFSINNSVHALSAPPTVCSNGAILMDAETGTILYSKNMDTPYPPASTTKTMTALLTFEKCNLSDMVTVGKNPPFIDGSRIGLVEGEKISVKDLLNGLLIESGNDCAIALAEHIAGSCDNFAVMMNKKAVQLGCTNTHFVNPHGLYDPNHKTSAKDLALIMRELVKHSDFKVMSTTPIYKIAATDKCRERYVNNKNKLLLKGSKYFYSYAEGAKTGYTTESKHSYVASASKNGERLILVLINSEKADYYGDVINLFNYGFDNYTLQKLFSVGDRIGELKKDTTNISLLASESCYYVREAGKKDIPTISINCSKTIKDSFKEGDNLGDVTVYYNGKPLNKINLLSNQNHIVKNKFALSTSKVPKLVFYISFTAAFSVFCILLFKYRKFKSSRS